MRAKTISSFAFLLFMVSLFSLSGCSKLSGPSDAEVIKAINDGGFFTRGMTLQSPIVVLEKGGRDKDGAWPVKVKVIFTYKIKNNQISAPQEETQVFYMRKAQDSTGHSIWRAAPTR